MTKILETIGKAREALENGDSQGGYAELCSLFARFPDVLEEHEKFVQAVGLLADLTRSFGAAALAALLESVRREPDDVQSLYQAAYELFEQGQYAAAATLLMRANRLDPGVAGVVTELVANLHELMFYPQAAQVLDHSGLPEKDPLCAYLSGYSRLMSGRVEEARERLDQLGGELEEPLPQMRDNLAGMVARAQALRAAGVELGPLSLTAWHAVINRCLLLHESPYGYEDAMRGRYAFVSDAASRVRAGLEGLRELLPLVGFAPRRVVAAPGRQSEIVAAAAARFLGLPWLAWRPGLESEGLVVAWTLESVEEEDFLEAVRTYAPAARLFVHASCWTAPFGFSPDFTTLLYQHITDPWTGGCLRVDPKTRDLIDTPPDERDNEELAAEILAAPPEESQLSLELVSRVASVLSALDHASQPSGPRLRQRAGGPVLSNHF